MIEEYRLIIRQLQSSEHECAMHWAIIFCAFSAQISDKLLVIRKIIDLLNGTQVKIKILRFLCRPLRTLRLNKY